jgi:small ligand-binding sensory domain FIST
MVTAARRAVQQALQPLGDQPKAGALFIDCMSTGWVLADAYAQQRSAVQQYLGDVPFLGFRSHGVLARLQGQTAGHYECSVAACVLPE